MPFIYQSTDAFRFSFVRPITGFRFLLIGLLALSLPALAQRDNNNNYLDSLQNWSFHFQFTNVVQGHTAFKGGGYQGPNTLSPQADTALSVTATLFAGRRLWRGASLYFNPEIAGGRGVGHRDNQFPNNEDLYNPAVGIAGFPNGETFRIGSPKPALYVARLYLEQVIPLSDEGYSEILSEANQVKQRLPESRIVITAGKFALVDLFDNNRYSHDPRTDFLNWALMSYGAWDYPANTRGYTYGLAVEYIRPTYAVRVAGSLMPKVANGNVLDWRFTRSGSLDLEFERQFKLLSRPGRVRLLGYRNVTKAPTYRSATEMLLAGTYPADRPYILTGTTYGGVKYGFGVNLEQPIGRWGGLFGRASWNDGRTATWAFTEIDRSYSLGGNLNGSPWKRSNDAIGLAWITNGISPDHRAFLAAGGRGFMLGDGALPNYGSEHILEANYNAHLARFLWMTADYQLVVNPGYNAGRGPVHLFALRTHLEI